MSKINLFSSLTLRDIYNSTLAYCPDTTKMKKVLCWKPKTSLDEGLRRTYAWAEKKLLHRQK